MNALFVTIDSLNLPCWRYPPLAGEQAEAPLSPVPDPGQQRDLLFDVGEDPYQSDDLSRKEPVVLQRMSDLLREALTQMNAPEEQFRRLGL